MKTYRGTQTGFEGVGFAGVTVDGRPLPPRLDLRNHSPTGFNWGYGGSGPAQLALAILCDHFGDDEKALSLYQQFKRDVITGLGVSHRTGEKEWTLTSADVKRALATRIKQLGPEPGGGSA